MHIISMSDTHRTLSDEATNPSTTSGSAQPTGNCTSGAQNDGLDVVTIVATVDDTDNSNHTSPKILRRMRFSNSMEILVLQAVSLHDAHILPHGMVQNRFEEVFDECF